MGAATGGGSPSLAPAAELPVAPDLAEIVTESRERLAEAPPLPSPGRKRGPYKPRAGKDSSAPVVTPDPASVAPLVPKVILATVVELPFDIAAARTKCPDMKLIEEESSAITDQVDACLRHYMPQMSERNAVLMTTLGTIAAVVLAKAIRYAEWKAERAHPPQLAPTDGAPAEPREPAAREAAPPAREAAPGMSIGLGGLGDPTKTERSAWQ